MKKNITQSIKIPEGINCIYESQILKCKNDNGELERKIFIPDVEVVLENDSIFLKCERGNKNTYKIIMSFMAHIRNLFAGLKEPFVYHLESANVHFPMTLKIDEGNLIINNFLGEKVPRKAKILPSAKVEIDGAKITITSISKESAGQTAANIEKAARVRGRDRRIYQDGIYITEKPKREMK